MYIRFSHWPNDNSSRHIFTFICYRRRLILFILIANYGWATLGLVLSFLIALGIGAKVAHDHLMEGNPPADNIITLMSFIT